MDSFYLLLDNRSTCPATKTIQGHLRPFYQLAIHCQTIYYVANGVFLLGFDWERFLNTLSWRDTITEEFVFVQKCNYGKL